jgi:hypothetical protein
MAAHRLLNAGLEERGHDSCLGGRRRCADHDYKLA